MGTFLNDFETLSEYSSIVPSALEQMPVELILIIFDFLPDNSRWNLACTSSMFMAIFKKWGSFSTIPIFYSKELSGITRSTLLKEILKPMKTTNIGISRMSQWDLFLGGKDSHLIATNYISRAEFYREVKGNYGIMIFEESENTSSFISRNDYFDRNTCPRAIAMLPLNNRSVNNIIPEGIRTSPRWREIFKQNMHDRNLAEHFIYMEAQVERNKERYRAR